MKKKKILIIVSIFVLLISAGGIISTSYPARVSHISFPAGQTTAYGIIYLPSGAEENQPEKYPLIFLLPGINTPAERYDHLARELARRNYASCALFLPREDGRHNYNVIIEANRYLEKNSPETDLTRKAFFAHSFGVVPALKRSYFDSSVLASVAVGYYAGGELIIRPNNLLIGTGLYDDLNGPEKIKMGVATFEPHLATEPGYRIGSFQENTALGWFIAPYSNHASEKNDPYIIQRTLNWFDRAFQLPLSQLPLYYPWYYLSVFFFIISSFIILTLVSTTLFSRDYGRLIWLLAMVVFFILFYSESVNPVFGFRAFFLLFLAGLTGNFCSRKAENEESFGLFTSGFLKLVSVFLIFLAGFILIQFLFSIPLYQKYQGFIQGFPGYIYFSYFVTFCTISQSSIAYIARFLPGIIHGLMILALGWFAIEIKHGGLTGETLEKYLLRLKEFLTYKKTESVSQTQKITVIIVSVTFVMVMIWFCRSGYVKPAIIIPYLIFLLRYLFLPLVFWGFTMHFTGLHKFYLNKQNFLY
ncbi:MAG: hypothetical protein ACLFQV_13830 [Vulcanimicrobiota bacterium]